MDGHKIAYVQLKDAQVGTFPGVSRKMCLKRNGLKRKRKSVELI